MLWAECDTDEVLEDRTFCIFGTGQAVKEELKHLSTVQMNGYVWHIYEKI
jgi:hypothetical protein